MNTPPVKIILRLQVIPTISEETTEKAFHELTRRKSRSVPQHLKISDRAPTVVGYTLVVGKSFMHPKVLPLGPDATNATRGITPVRLHPSRVDIDQAAT